MLQKLILFYGVFTTVHIPLASATDSCGTRMSCGECIRDPNLCVWCAMDNFNSTQCKSQGSYNDDWCSKDSIQNPQNSIIASEAREFSSTSDNVIQMKPQRYKLKLRPGIADNFNFSFQAAQNFPVDLYFLLDASKSMSTITQMTADSSENIYLAIQNMTNDVHLGLGTFVDKRVLPFTNTFNAEQTYSFRHHLKLVDDFKKFKEMVSKTPKGHNRDVQEGGFDALAQVMVCKEVIGWRNESRKIVVFITDGPYHAAGDGKSAGLFQPYDGKCYTKNDLYTKELEMDYPSVGMINKLATDNDIIILFLVDDKVKNIYQTLSNVVSGSEVVSYFKQKNMESYDIVNILKDIYEKISKKIKLNVNVKTGRKKNFQISFKPDCTSDSSGDECDVEVGKEHQLVGTVKLLDYDGTNNSIIDIVVEGIGEKLTLDIDVIKSCECEQNVQKSSTFCHGEDYFCGKCSCSSKRYGDRCACIKSTNKMASSNKTCIAEGSTEICSGHGSCDCGTCKCRPNYEGKFCECNMNSCPRGAVSGAVCNGQGKCFCGKCTCATYWTGEACDCFNSDADCKGHDGSICHNRGNCKCNECNCDPLGDWDARKQQDKKCKVKVCPDCHEVQCRKLEDLTRCQLNGQDCTPNDQVKVELVENLPEEYLNSSVWNVCGNVNVKVGCYTTFVYRYNDTDYSLELVVATKTDCAKTYYLFGGVSLIALVLIGAGTLIAWKLLTEARDRHEYMQFLQKNKHDASGPSNNPLYEPPSTTFNNPTFRKKSVDFR